MVQGWWPVAVVASLASAVRRLRPLQRRCRGRGGRMLGRNGGGMGVCSWIGSCLVLWLGGSALSAGFRCEASRHGSSWVGERGGCGLGLLEGSGDAAVAARHPWSRRLLSGGCCGGWDGLGVAASGWLWRISGSGLGRVMGLGHWAWMWGGSLIWAGPWLWAHGLGFVSVFVFFTAFVCFVFSIKRSGRRPGMCTHSARYSLLRWRGLCVVKWLLPLRSRMKLNVAGMFQWQYNGRADHHSYLWFFRNFFFSLCHQTCKAIGVAIVAILANRCLIEYLGFVATTDSISESDYIMGSRFYVPPLYSVVSVIVFV